MVNVNRNPRARWRIPRPVPLRARTSCTRKDHP